MEVQVRCLADGLFSESKTLDENPNLSLVYLLDSLAETVLVARGLLVYK